MGTMAALLDLHHLGHAQRGADQIVVVASSGIALGSTEVAVLSL